MPKLNTAVTYNGERFRITTMNVLNNSVRLSNKEHAVDLTIGELKKILPNKNGAAEESAENSAE